MLIFTVVVNFWLVLAAVPLLILLFFLRQYSVASITDLRRLDAQSRLHVILCYLTILLTCSVQSVLTPFYSGRTSIYTVLMDTINGLPQLRAMAKEAYFEQQFHRHHDLNTSVRFLYFNSYRWMGVRTECLLTVLLFSSLMAAISVGSLGIYTFTVLVSLLSSSFYEQGVFSVMSANKEVVNLLGVNNT